MGNHQFVTGKVLAGAESTEAPNPTFLNDIRRTKSKPIVKQSLPETANQEFGFFTQLQPNCSYRQDRRIFHPQRLCDLNQYMDVFWKYYPPPPASFHPKAK